MTTMTPASAVVAAWIGAHTRSVPASSAGEAPLAKRTRRVRIHAPAANNPAPANVEFTFPNLPMLAAMVRSIPPATRVILLFPPLSIEVQGVPGSIAASRWAACKREVSDLARQRGALVLDFAGVSRITTDRNNYWDPVHYRQAIAGRVMEGLIAGSSPDATTLSSVSGGLDPRGTDSR